MLPYHIIDAFTHEPFGGNPAAVVLVSTFPADVRMQCIARFARPWGAWRTLAAIEY